MSIDTFSVCLRCDYRRTEQDDEFYSSEECPKCGVIYSKIIEPEELNKETTNYLEGKTLCNDESCSGIVGPDNRCDECGKTLEEKSIIERAIVEDGKQANLTAWEADNRKKSHLANEKQKQIDFAKDFICKDCGHEGMPEKIIKGGEGIEITLWLVGVLITLLSVLTGFLILTVPLVYSLWRRTGRKGCSKCQGHMIHKDSPMGKKLLEELSD